MTQLERAAAWVWDHLPGGVPTQLKTWRLFPKLADWCERQANRKDERTPWDAK